MAVSEIRKLNKFAWYSGPGVHHLATPMHFYTMSTINYSFVDFRSAVGSVIVFQLFVVLTVYFVLHTLQI